MRARKAKAGADAPAKGKLAQLFKEEDEKVDKKRKDGFMPFRLWMKPGTSQEIIILDNSLEEAFSRREHNVQGSDGKYNNFETCLADSGEECPNCKQYGDNSYLVAFLSALVLKEWTSKKTGEVHKYSKMLVPIKRGQFGKFTKLAAVIEKQKGILRGTYLVMEREDVDKSSAIGEPSTLEDGTQFDHYSEDDLVAEFGHKEVKSRDGKILKAANQDIQVFDYLKLFPEETKEDLETQLGIDPDPTPGSKEEAVKELSDEDDNMDMSQTLASLGGVADVAGEESCPEIEEAATALDIDVNEYETWAEVGEKLDALKLAKDKPAAKKRASTKRRGRKSAAKAESGGGEIEQKGW